MARRSAEAVEPGQDLGRVEPDLWRGHIGMPVLGLGVAQGEAVEQQARAVEGAAAHREIGLRTARALVAHRQPRHLFEQ